VRILITGGLGNLGLWLTHYFLGKGNEVTVLGRTEKYQIKHKGYRFVTADVTKTDSLLEAIDCYFDVCVHAASFNEHFSENYAEKALLINSLGTDNLCRALLKLGVGKLIYLSTFHVYGAHSGNIDEMSDISPLNDYGLTHYFAEKYIEKYGASSSLNYVIFRLTNSYGCPKDIATDKWYLIFNDFCKQAFDNSEIVIRGNPLARRDFIWMGDVVKIIAEVIKSTSIVNTCLNLSSSQSVSLMDLAEIVSSVYIDFIGHDLDVVYAGDSCDVEELKVSNRKLIEVLPFSFSDQFHEESRKIFELLNSRAQID